MEPEIKKNKQGVKLLVILLILLILALIGLVCYDMFFNKEEVAENEIANETTKENKIKTNNVIEDTSIFSGDGRTLAFVIDKDMLGVGPAGLNDAYITYEILTENGKTALMPIYKNLDMNTTVGPISKLRHYFIDYAMENDAILFNNGYTPRAQSDLNSLGMDYINAETENSRIFELINGTENVVTKTEGAKGLVEQKGMRTTSDKDALFKYSTKDKNPTGDKTANGITITFSDDNVVTFRYDSSQKRYLRLENGEVMKDSFTGQDITAKNIIIQVVRYADLNETGQNTEGWQTLHNINNVDGYYISNGKAIEIVCSKTARGSKTKYKDKATDEEIEINDGNTFIEIVSVNTKVDMATMFTTTNENNTTNTENENNTNSTNTTNTRR